MRDDSWRATVERLARPRDTGMPDGDVLGGLRCGCGRCDLLVGSMCTDGGAGHGGDSLEIGLRCCFMSESIDSLTSPSHFRRCLPVYSSHRQSVPDVFKSITLHSRYDIPPSPSLHVCPRPAQTSPSTSTSGSSTATHWYQSRRHVTATGARRAQAHLRRQVLRQLPLHLTKDILRSLACTQQGQPQTRSRQCRS